MVRTEKVRLFYYSDLLFRPLGQNRIRRSHKRRDYLVNLEYIMGWIARFYLENGDDIFMQEWKIALEEFLKDWKIRNDVVGALVCGSYITGNPSKRSDIDVHILLSDDVEWRERGNRIINGFLIEYFVNPPKQIRRYFQEDFQDHRTMSMVQFITGMTLFDKTGIITEIKVEAQKWIKKDYKELNEIVTQNLIILL